ncbi:hypothetical protein B0H14DRAFT_3082403 [Mycena olivaceomarginata]|nr:hypothetical protein B0H14DRAFT_3082403 [Mycena olivaceomarginata]
MVDAEVHRPITTFVDRPSEDRRRVYHDIVPIEPPSPVKKARIVAPPAPLPHPHRETRSSDLPHGDEDESYQMHLNLDMHLDDDAQDPPVPPLPDLGRKRKAIYSDPTLYSWKENSRDHYVREFLRMDGRGDATEDLCPGCKIDGQRPAYRCRECKGALLFCKECSVKQHLENPLHIVEAWNGTRFLRTSLKAMGLRVQFGHPPGERCTNPERGREAFVVLHHNSIHEVAVDFCGVGCDNRARAGENDTQLLRGGWYPVSEERPQTCMTLLALEQFHIQSLQAKITMYDYYQSLEKLTSNDGTKPPDRYQVFTRICRAYRHVMMLKRMGRGHDPGGAKATKSGALAVLCPACPRPGINLPEDWEEVSKEDRCVYLFILCFFALDACFRMKHGLVSSELKDPGLGTGMAYMLENVPYREYLLTVTDQKEMSTCSGLAALDYANTKFSRGYSTTGVGMGVCARHEFIQPNGVGDLQKGERFANMDYIFASILRHHDPLLWLIVSYDIVCQWWKTLFERLLSLPELVRFVLILPLVAFVIPKMHIHAHTLMCGILYSLNLIPGSGQTDGEGIERPWSNIGGIASSTRIMGPGARHDTIDDHWGHWNWQKLISLAATLRRRLDTALEQQMIQREALAVFSQQQQDQVEEWKKMVHDYEEDRTKKNPYEAVVVGELNRLGLGLTEKEVRLQFQKEEEAKAKRGLPAKHKVTPSAFMTECLAVEEEQREVRIQAELKKAQTTTQQVDMGVLRTKLIRRLERLRKLQDTYSPASIIALEKRKAPADERPENEPLFLPSALTEAERGQGGCTEGLLEMELLMRNAQCRGAIVKLRNQLVIKARFLNYKSLHSRHQGANTRSRTIVNRNELKIRLHSEKYQVAWAVLFSNAGQKEAEMGWRKLRKEDIRCMEDAEDVKRKAEKRKRAKERRKKKLEELLSHGAKLPVWVEEGSEDEELMEAETGTERGTESRREISWIWTGAALSGTDAGLEDALRIEWAKAYARSRRWDEEVRLLREEFRRVPITLEWQAEMWERRASEVDVGTGVLEQAYAEGMAAYALKQEALFQGRRGRELRLWTPYKTQWEENRGDEAEAEDDGDDDAVLWAGADDGDGDEERVEIESDEELVMGGEVDDF